MSQTIMVISASIDGRLIKAVESARELGYRTVACVREEDDVSIVKADRCYAVNGGNTEKLLEIARCERIDGVLGLFDQSVLSAAIIAEELGLPGNSPACVRRLLGKGSFRKLQKEAGVFCPEFFETDTPEGLEERCAGLRFPIIMKPDLCSSSFGQTVLYDVNDLGPAFAKAASHSSNGVVCVEEFIEQEDPLRVLEADIFLMGDEILWDGMHWNDRFPEAPLRPITDVFPATLDSRQEAAFKSAVGDALSASGARIGEFNIEGFFTKAGQYFVIEINPRPAGYYSQQDIKMHCGVDLTRLLVTTAVGDLSYFEELKTFERQKRNILMYPIFSFRPGVFDHVHFDPAIKEALLIFRPFPGGEPGAYVEDIHADNRPVGVAVFGFPTWDEMEQARRNIRQLVYVVLRDPDPERQLSM